MPGRRVALVNFEYYHVYNRSIENKCVFIESEDYIRANQSLNYYRYKNPPVKLSSLLSMSLARYSSVFSELEKQGNKLVDILAYCLMPNHFHFLLRQKIDRGISTYMSNFQNSYTRYFNTNNKRRGPIFLTKFKAKRIEREEQLLHVSRYIHLNPFSAKEVSDIKDLEEYPWSSFPEYLSKEEKTICKTDTILSYFNTAESYKNFVFDRADYQRQLQEIKKLI
jgi:putative transposase